MVTSKSKRQLYNCDFKVTNSWIIFENYVMDFSSISSIRTIELPGGTYLPREWSCYISLPTILLVCQNCQTKNI